MGTSLALAGGYNLAGALVQQPYDIAAAFALYEEEQRRLVEPAQALSPMIGLAFNMVTPWQVWSMNWFAACVAFFAPVFKFVFLLLAPERGKPTLRKYSFNAPVHG
jgi:2-polyprenyl-6-methoxyphenol hydroxylase-like FAD-dependent oxidoreductase